MTVSEESLMAFADGELVGDEALKVEQAMREDPQVALKVERHRALKQRLQGAFAAELKEPVPERLLAAARGKERARATVTDLSSARQKLPAAQRMWWRPVSSLAASVLLGVALGFGLFHGAGSPIGQERGGALVAQGDLDRALSHQLSAVQSKDARVHIGVSFLAKSGDYCRSFALKGEASSAGIACRHEARWRIETLAGPTPGESGEYRTAGASMPASILKAMEERIQGEPLDAKGEEEASRRGWH
jgi:hypothetical protein